MKASLAQCGLKALALDIKLSSCLNHWQTQPPLALIAEAQTEAQELHNMLMDLFREEPEATPVPSDEVRQLTNTESVTFKYGGWKITMTPPLSPPKRKRCQVCWLPIDDGEDWAGTPDGWIHTRCL